MADAHTNVTSYPDGTSNTDPIAEDIVTNGEGKSVRRQWVRSFQVDGDSATLGATGDAAQTNPAAAGSMIALLKGIISTLKGTLVRSGFSSGSNGTTTANTDYSLTFAVQATAFYVQNTSTNPIWVDFDTPATQGATIIAAGQMIPFNLPCTVLHIMTTVATKVNGTTSGGIVVVGFH